MPESGEPHPGWRGEREVVSADMTATRDEKRFVSKPETKILQLVSAMLSRLQLTPRPAAGRLEVKFITSQDLLRRARWVLAGYPSQAARTNVAALVPRDATVAASLAFAADLAASNVIAAAVYGKAEHEGNQDRSKTIAISASDSS